MGMPMEAKKILPEISFSASELPEIKSWKVGGKYKLVLEVEQIGDVKDQYGDGERRARFKILGVKSPGVKKPTRYT